MQVIGKCMEAAHSAQAECAVFPDVLMHLLCLTDKEAAA